MTSHDLRRCLAFTMLVAFTTAAAAEEKKSDGAPAAKTTRQKQTTDSDGKTVGKQPGQGSACRAASPPCPIQCVEVGSACREGAMVHQPPQGKEM